MAITKQDLLAALQIVRDMQAADVNDKAALAEASARAESYKADHDLLNDPELDAAFDEVINNAAGTPPPGPPPQPAPEPTPEPGPETPPEG